MGLAEILASGGLGQAATFDPAAPQQQKSWWQDPNMLSILLGKAGQAVMGPHQNTWQAGVGKMAANMGAGNKYQMASRKREHELMSMLAGAFGFTPKGTPGPTEMKMGADGKYSMTGDLPTDETGALKMEGPDSLSREGSPLLQKFMADYEPGPF